MALSGSPKRVTIDGTVYDVAADANFTQNPNSQMEGIATSGKTMFKTTRQVANVESVTLIVDGASYELLLTAQENAKNGETYAMSYTLASGDVYRATGIINVESRETETNTATVMMIPEGDWQPFLA